MATDLRPITASTSRSAPAGKYEAYAEKQLARTRHRIRALDVGAGALGLVVVTLTYGLVMVVCDRALELSSLARQVAFGLYVAGALAYLGLMLIWPLFRRINPYYAARRLEKTIPQAKNSVVNWLDLRGQSIVPAFRSAIGYQAAKDLAQADVEQAVSARRTSWLGAAAFALLLVLLILFVTSPAQLRSLLNRAFAPFSEITIACRTRISLVKPEGGDVTIPLGKAVTFAVWVEGKVPSATSPDALRLQYRYNPSDPYEERLLTRGDSEREWGTLVPAAEVHNGFWYRVAGGDDHTPEYRVQVRSSPLLTGFDVTYHYRPYLGWHDRVSRDPNLQELRGTQVTLVAHTNRTVKDGQLIITGDKQLPAEPVPDDPQALRFRMVLEKDGVYRIWFTSADGERSAEPLPYTIKAVYDNAPQVELRKPGRDVDLPSNGVLHLEGSASDDFGITGLRLRMKPETGPKLQPRPYRDGKSFKLPDGGYPRALDYKDFVELDKLKEASGAPRKLEPGQVIEYWLEAVDNCDFPGPNVGESKHFKVKIQPPDTDKNKQKEEREQARQEQKKHENEQDKQLQQQQRAENPQKDPQQQAPKNSDGGKSEDQKVKEKADQIQKEIDKQQQENQGGNPGEPKNQKPQESKEGTKGEQPSNPNAAPGENKQNPKDNQPQQEPGQSKGEGNQQAKPDGKQKGENKPGQGSDSERDKNGEQKPDSGSKGEPSGKSGKPGDNANPKPADNPQKGTDDKKGEQDKNPGAPNADKKNEQPQPGAEKPQPMRDENQKGTGGDQVGEKKAESKSSPKNEGQDGGNSQQAGNEQRGAKTSGKPESDRGGKKNPSSGTGNEQGERREVSPPMQNTPKPGNNNGSAGGQPKVKPTNDGTGAQPKPGEPKPGDQKNDGAAKAEEKPAGQEQGKGERRDVSPPVPGKEPTPPEKGENKEPGSKPSPEPKPAGDKKPDDNQPGAAGDKGEKKEPGERRGVGEGDKKQAQKELEALSKALQSNDPKTREDAARKLQDLINQSKDPATRQAAKEALKQPNQDGGAKPGEQQGVNDTKPGTSEDKGGSPQPSKTGEKSSTANDQKQGGQPGADKGERQSAQPGEAKGPGSKEGQGSGNKKPSDNAGKEPGQQGSGSNPGSSGGSGRSGGNEPSAQPPMPNNSGANPDQPDVEEGSVPDQRYLKKAGELQLENIKKKVNKDVLKRLNMTDEEYQQFLKAYEAMLKRQAPPTAEKEDAVTPFRGNRDQQNQGVRKVEPGAQTKTGNLDRLGPTLAPPEFREAYKEFSRRLSELERSREKK
jgi:hypothetical protein